MACVSNQYILSIFGFVHPCRRLLHSYSPYCEFMSNVATGTHPDIFSGQDLCFYCMSKTNFLGKNKFGGNCL